MSVNQKVLDHLTKTASGRKKVEMAVKGEVSKEVIYLQNAVIQAQSELPFDFGVTNEEIKVAISPSGNVVAECDIIFNHEDAKRTAFYTKGRWDHADLIYLFNNGYSYDSDRPPSGMWHNRWTAALTERDGLHFIQEAVKSYLSGAPVDVKVDIDQSYD